MIWGYHDFWKHPSSQNPISFFEKKTVKGPGKSDFCRSHSMVMILDSIFEISKETSEG